ncbi:hypothetical protein HWC92_gp22 [Flavobacterium phage vB_FspS_morran9-1]|uniref:Uncharacterized protein n=6 Tax=Lillamyvirus TaxID=2843418 RepID=A0A6B9LC83_9CAUD|nr:hypothetical protein HWC89_gp19 [Flavobacterium phage vB_FspS_hemulen6-1]YP_009854950.1 hypothetical protein HWC92_gp22 [Flavobacterium phage vB_FspS_morran9-1]YP_009855371.1 hypothetical protein HWC98_gp16 [Flavobacterium phage vB_FspS_stinky9-1]QHB38850.1 hypothetical protein hemulen62_gp019 [Flavobacterium phage vB_FspS_hemulen6-2]QHB38920.1 hypothetical protein hemulen91_gp019 [Flavobacterium phage vB_FspS_hemulen9-1]QHB39413.1 hypothetical protein lillamy96_gp020 [Flavobacterium phage 
MWSRNSESFSFRLIYRHKNKYKLITNATIAYNRC